MKYFRLLEGLEYPYDTETKFEEFGIIAEDQLDAYRQLGYLKDREYLGHGVVIVRKLEEITDPEELKKLAKSYEKKVKH